MRRLFPALAALLIAYVAINGISTIPKLLPILLYVSNYFIVAVPEQLSHTWSLAIEEQFYIVWPLVLWLMLRKRGKSFAIYLTAGAIVVINIWRVVVWFHDKNATHLYFYTDTRADDLLVGCLVALLPIFSKFRRTIQLSFVGVLVLCAFLPYASTFWPQTVAGGVVAAGTALLIGAMNRPTLTGQLLSMRLLRGVGKISYGLYLWQFLIFETLNNVRPFNGMNAVERFLTLGGLSFLAAVVSFEVLERRFTHAPSLFAPHDR